GKRKEAIGETLEELWLSYNLIEKIKGVGVLKRLKVLYLSNNIVKDWPEFNKLQEIPNLEDLVFVGNPLSESYDENMWRAEAIKRLPNLKKLDGEPDVVLIKLFPFLPGRVFTSLIERRDCHSEKRVETSEVLLRGGSRIFMRGSRVLSRDQVREVPIKTGLILSPKDLEFNASLFKA
ncbi:unnamed protein product, partial [Timema podura]|nr:unnamed protein product [Timema podura]